MQLHPGTPQQSRCTELNTNITQLPPNDEIWYTSSDGKIVMPTHNSVFGVEIVSNTYNNGKGVIKFNGEVTEIGKQAFYHCDAFTRQLFMISAIAAGDKTPSWMHIAISSSNITSITLPQSVTKIGEQAFSDCHDLISVTIPDSVTEICGRAFL